MSRFLDIAGLAAVASLLLGLASAFTVGILYPRRRAHALALGPTARARRTFWWSVSPPVLGVALTMLCFVPSGLAGIGLGSDHCPDHDDHHPHLCLRHPPHGDALGLIAYAPLLAGSALLAGATMLAARSRRLVRSLAPLAAPHPTRDFVRLNATRPLCFTAGLVRPRVYVSSGLLSALGSASLEVVLEHEKAHVRRRDPFLWWLTSTLSLLHLPPTRRLLLADFALACEEACDDRAARRLGDPILVAETILSVERLLALRSTRLPGPAFAFGGSNIDARVRTLLHPPADRTPRWRWTSRVVVALLALAAASPLHHLTETALGLFTR